jgi:hypothetical protein
MMDFAAMVERMKRLSPQEIEALADGFAQQGVPAPAGGMAGMAQAFQAVGQNQAGPQQMLPPDQNVNFGNQTPVTTSESKILGELLAQQAQPAQPQAQGLTPEQAMAQGQAVQNPAPPKQYNPPYLANLSYGAAPGAHGLQTQAPMLPGGPPGLGALLMGRR